MPDVVITPVPSRGPPRRSRTLDERLMVRFPGAYRRLTAAAAVRLRPRSRLRRAALRRGVISGWAALNRQDFDLMLVRYAPDVEFVFADGFRSLGLDRTYRGHEEMLAGMRELTDSWDPLELEPAYVVDLGDVILNLGFIRAQGRASGARVETEIAQVVVTRDGLVASDRSWDTWDDGLRAVGLDPERLALPRRQPGDAGSLASRSASSRSR